MSSMHTFAAIWPRPQDMKAAPGELAVRKPLALRIAGGAPWIHEAVHEVENIFSECGCPICSLHDRRGRAEPQFLVGPADDPAMREALGEKPVTRKEGYALRISRSGVILAAADAAGAHYALRTLAQLCRRKGNGCVLPLGTIRDWPAYDIRGFHCYMPGRGELDFFVRQLDFLSRQKYNTLFLEIGAGMAYDRHPEINRAWRKLCRDAVAYPGGMVGIQSSQPFWKDSMHVELGEGDCLTKPEVRRIINEARRRHIRIIPEVQSLSHAYYLCCAHPEIAERKEDPWPDTYCPSNPKSYELLFDVMEEVIEMFQPTIMHIGHDEAYTFCICPRCRKRNAAEIFAADVTKIHDFLAARGIETLMWSDKFMNFVGTNGQRYGGIRRVRKDENGKVLRDPHTGRPVVMPATYRSVDRVPKDIICCDWYWGLAPDTQDFFAKKGFRQMFGNFQPLAMKDFVRRARRGHILGAEISSWCANSVFAMGHNAVLHHLYVGADDLWNGRPQPLRESVRRTAAALPREIDRLSERERLLPSGRPVDVHPFDLSARLSELPEEVAHGLGRTRSARIEPGGIVLPLAPGKGIVLDEKSPVATLAVAGKADALLFLQTTTIPAFFRYTFYSRGRAPEVLGRYDVRYADGSSAEVEVVFGHHLSRFGWGYTELVPPIEDFEVKGEQRVSTYSYESYPVFLDGGGVLYAQEWTNPHPEKAIREITFRLATNEGEGALAILAVSRLSVT